MSFLFWLMAMGKSWLHTRLSRFVVRGTRGSILIELAVAAPLLVFLALGGTEFVLYLMLDHRLRYLANRVADLTARETLVDDRQLDTVYAIAPNLMRPFSFYSDSREGRIIVSVIRRPQPTAPDAVIIKQGAGGGLLNVESRLGVQGQNATLPQDFVLESWETVVAAEVFYDYEPWFLIDIFSSPHRLYHRALYRPRVPATFSVASGPATFGPAAFGPAAFGMTSLPAPPVSAGKKVGS